MCLSSGYSRWQIISYHFLIAVILKKLFEFIYSILESKRRKNSIVSESQIIFTYIYISVISVIGNERKEKGDIWQRVHCAG